MIQVRKTTPMKPHKSSLLGKRAWSVSHWRKDRKAQRRTTTRDQPRISHFMKEAIKYRPEVRGLMQDLGSFHLTLRTFFPTPPFILSSIFPMILSLALRSLLLEPSPAFRFSPVFSLPRASYLEPFLSEFPILHPRSPGWPESLSRSDGRNVPAI